MILLLYAMMCRDSQASTVPIGELAGLVPKSELYKRELRNQWNLISRLPKSKQSKLRPHFHINFNAEHVGWKTSVTINGHWLLQYRCSIYHKREQLLPYLLMQLSLRSTDRKAPSKRSNNFQITRMCKLGCTPASSRYQWQGNGLFHSNLQPKLQRDNPWLKYRSTESRCLRKVP
mgnify:CR=1 FL=1